MKDVFKTFFVTLSFLFAFALSLNRANASDTSLFQQFEEQLKERVVSSRPPYQVNLETSSPHEFALFRVFFELVYFDGSRRVYTPDLLFPVDQVDVYVKTKSSKEAQQLGLYHQITSAHDERTFNLNRLNFAEAVVYSFSSREKITDAKYVSPAFKPIGLLSGDFYEGKSARENIKIDSADDDRRYYHDGFPLRLKDYGLSLPTSDEYKRLSHTLNRIFAAARAQVDRKKIVPAPQEESLVELASWDKLGRRNYQLSRIIEINNSLRSPMSCSAVTNGSRR